MTNVEVIIDAYLHKHMQRAVNHVQSIRNSVAFVEKANAAGFKFVYSAWDAQNGYNFTTTIPVEDVAKLRNAIGRLKAICKSSATQDIRKPMVKVTLEAVDFPGVTVEYKKKLPRSAKCKLRRVKTSYVTLVCE
jgi:hypothetical protein